MQEPETEQLLEEDLAASRNPAASAIHLAHKLASTPDGGWRYTCPSYEMARVSDGAQVTAPGIEPTLAYEVVIANLAPELTRRDAPESVAEVLDWAGEPLATMEVADVCGLDLEGAREQLGRVATEEHVGKDGLWALQPVAV